jgi:hypothetical protein
MGLNSIGIYGFLARAHIEHALAGDVAVAGRAANVEARLAVQSNTVADLDRRMRKSIPQWRKLLSAAEQMAPWRSLPTSAVIVPI